MNITLKITSLPKEAVWTGVIEHGSPIPYTLTPVGGIRRVDPDETFRYLGVVPPVKVFYGWDIGTQYYPEEQRFSALNDGDTITYDVISKKWSVIPALIPQPTPAPIPTPVPSPVPAPSPSPVTYRVPVEVIIYHEGDQRIYPALKEAKDWLSGNTPIRVEFDAKRSLHQDSNSPIEREQSAKGFWGVGPDPGRICWIEISRKAPVVILPWSCGDSRPCPEWEAYTYPVWQWRWGHKTTVITIPYSPWWAFEYPDPGEWVEGITSNFALDVLHEFHNAIWKWASYFGIKLLDTYRPALPDEPWLDESNKALYPTRGHLYKAFFDQKGITEALEKLK